MSIEETDIRTLGELTEQNTSSINQIERRLDTIEIARLAELEQRLATLETAIGSLSFVHRNEAWALRNYNKKVRNYPEGSIGEMNGDNYEVIPITEAMTLDWLVAHMKEGREVRA